MTEMKYIILSYFEFYSVLNWVAGFHNWELELLFSDILLLFWLI